MEPYPPRSYFLTPYYRGVVEENNNYDNQCSEEPDTTQNPYLLFCLMTRFQAIVPNYYLMYITMYINNKMQTALLVTNATTPVELDEETYNYYQSIINQIIEKNPWECLIFEPTDKLVEVPKWYQEWVLEMIDVPQDYKLRFERNPWTNQVGIYADLRSKDVNGEFISIFDSQYQELVDLIQNEIIEMYQEGYIICSRNHANKFKLSIIKTLESGHVLAVPNWDIKEYSKDISPTTHLMVSIHMDKSFNDIVGLK